LESFNDLIPEGFVDLLWERIQNATKELNQLNGLLLETGWFYDFYIMSEIVTDLLKNKNYSQIDTIFSDFFEKETKIIEKKCLDRFPLRKSIILKAFKAYRRKDYETSIILFLTQIDGMFKDISQKSIFSRNKNFKAQAWLIELEQTGKGDLVLAALSALAETKLLSLDFNEARNYPNIIARNMILHGHELNFGTKKNCLKTISLISFIAGTVYNIGLKDRLFDDLKIN
jgi:hypothetical protein